MSTKRTPGRKKGQTGGGPIQTGKREEPTRYQIGGAKFLATPYRDDTGDRFIAFLESHQISYTEFIRCCVKEYESRPETFSFLFN